MYKITLEDGTILDNLELNGNNYISSTIIDDNVFKNNLKTVSISDGTNTIEHKNMKLVQNKVFKNQSWFILAEKSKDEIEKESTLLTLTEMYEENLKLKQENEATMLALAELYERILT